MSLNGGTKRKQSKGNKEGQAKLVTDARFASLHTDPRFVKPKRASNKIVLDDRFKSLFEPDPTTGKASKKRAVDRFGRPLNKDHSQDELRKFYRLDDDEEAEERERKDPEAQGVSTQNKGKGKAQESAQEFVDYARGQALLESSSEEEDEEEEEEEQAESSEDDGEIILGPSTSRSKPKRARSASPSGSEISIDLNEDDIQVVRHSLQDEPRAELIEDDAPLEEGIESRRIAVVNLDWDNIRAADLFKVFSSVLAPDRGTLQQSEADAARTSTSGLPSAVMKRVRGRVISVSIYPSEFGRERMAREEREGPPKDIFLPAEQSDDSDVDPDDIDEKTVLQQEEGEEFDEVALRKYQLERLRYYYAVIEFDSVQAAKHAYREIDGTEFGRTANFFDLRYIPDEMDFTADPIKEKATSVAADYNTRDFVTDALRHSKVKLTWDADDVERARFTRLDTTKLTKDDLEKLDFQPFLASDSSDYESEEEEAVQSEEDAPPRSTMSRAESRLAKREQLRRAFGLDEGEAAEDDFFEKKDNKQDLEITFAPALSGRAAKTDLAPAEPETSLDAYRRKTKQQKETKKQAKAAADEAMPDEKPVVKSKQARRAAKEAAQAKEQRQAAELALLVASDSEEDSEKLPGKHFDMRAIIKAEKEKGKKKRSRKHGKVKSDAEVQDSFEIDVADNRFASLHDHHEFAIDPSNPHYIKTKNMERLLSEGRNKRQKLAPQVDATSSTASMPSKPTDDLAKLISAVKRKSESQSKPKRA
ncbi:uncharacterized protein L969DRAFT_47566 [Mixia osmundae IAM 14324]|uniref:Uncharacterized protein n=1 Tax=Mixia osmundae (strain CBS 9802 / IAM 14324 / JCM 22182 / KY 12970) TaxID=764103 RepID=G7E914_MIXOS|nr:uncharacterized protein L969DRAFT_47566 [Mixia osmundae IAM 14324]KEI40268.1 hypothetical protein L969DRAFT_47566 [Mixia osmundae IAM 14324]GAA99632.1 hypothetical protein E5Q_06333 [Mixia osmundae IAM 14324]